MLATAKRQKVIAKANFHFPVSQFNNNATRPESKKSPVVVPIIVGICVPVCRESLKK